MTANQHAAIVELMRIGLTHVVPVIDAAIRNREASHKALHDIMDHFQLHPDVKTVDAKCFKKGTAARRLFEECPPVLNRAEVVRMIAWTEEKLNDTTAALEACTAALAYAEDGRWVLLKAEDDDKIVVNGKAA